MVKVRVRYYVRGWCLRQPLSLCSWLASSPTSLVHEIMVKLTSYFFFQIKKPDNDLSGFLILVIL